MKVFLMLRTKIVLQEPKMAYVSFRIRMHTSTRAVEHALRSKRTHTHQNNNSSQKPGTTHIDAHSGEAQ